MMGLRLERGAIGATLLVGLLTLTSCPSSSSSGGGDFLLVSSNLVTGAQWEINRAVRLTFNQDVDSNTINSSTIAITALPQTVPSGAEGGLVVGEFYVDADDSKTVVFQPQCPTDASNSNGGFVPNNGVAGPPYRLTVLGDDSTSGETVRSTAGARLAVGTTIDFTTRGPADPYLDPLPQPVGVSSTTNYPPDGASVLPLFLLAEAPDPIEIHLDQPVQGSSFVNDTDGGSVRFKFESTAGSDTYDMSIPVTLELDNCTTGGATITVTPIGVLPAGLRARLEIDKDLLDLAGTGNVQDINLTPMTIASKGVPQLDAIIENFDTQDNFDADNTESFFPTATWSGGSVKAAEPLPGVTSDPTVDITISSTVTVDTNSSVLQGTSTVDGSPVNVTVTNGLIKVRNFTVADGGTVIGSGTNPLKILATGDVTVALGGKISVDGGDSPTAASQDEPTTQADAAEVGGVGQAGGGNGGRGSPTTTGSSGKGEDGFGADQEPAAGGLGGHSAIGETVEINVRAGGGGGANWGLSGSSGVVNEGNLSANGNHYVCTEDGNSTYTQTECDCATSGDGVGTNLNGEPGTDGTATATDTITGIAPPKGGFINNADTTNGPHPMGGPAVFADTDALNDYWGIGLDITTTPYSVRLGELEAAQGGGGGGGGGDGIPADTTTFPPGGAHDFLQDFKGGSGGGGAGVLIIQALGTVTIDGELSADGGDGGGGEATGDLSRIGGGGGGGSGGHIIVMSSTEVIVGSTTSSSTSNPNIHAFGGNRGYGNLKVGSAECYREGNSIMGQTANTDQGDGLGMDSSGASEMATNRGGAGGSGVIQISVPRQTGDNIGRIDLTKFTVSNAPFNDDDALRLDDSGFTNVTIEPNAHLLAPDFGQISVAKSEWYETEWANFFDSSNTPNFTFGDLNGTVINPDATTTLVTGSAGDVVINGPQSATITNSTLYSLVVTNPKVLINDDFIPSSGADPLRITNAVFDGSSIVITTDSDDGDLTAAGTWSVVRKFFSVETDGDEDFMPAGSTITISFEGANEASPAGSGSADTSDVTGPVTDISLLDGKKFIRFIVTFDLGSTVTASTGRPELNFFKGLFSF